MSTTHHVYRVEHPQTKHGPYIGGMICDGSPDARHPTPAEEGLVKCNLDLSDSAWRCGFESLDALLEWFYDELEVLRAYDYHCAVYEVVEVRKGAKQLLFKHTTGIPVKTISI